MAKRGKRPKPQKERRPRNPFAGRRRSGAGFHSETKYGKKQRRGVRREIEDAEPDEDRGPD